jgi:hypothetical protein
LPISLLLDPDSGELNQCGYGSADFSVGRHQSRLKLSARERTQITLSDSVYVSAVVTTLITLGSIFSVNTWVESPMDDEARVEEGLVRLQAAMLAKTIPRYLQKYFRYELYIYCILHGSISVLD